MHEIRDSYINKSSEQANWLEDLAADGGWHEFKAYMSHWLSCLYVVSEGAREIGIDEIFLNELIDLHIENLRIYRNATFHFQRVPSKHAQFHDSAANRLNWAEDVHSAFEEFFGNYVLYLSMEISIKRYLR